MKLRVLNPTGVMEVEQSHAPRLASLDGITLAELSNGVWHDDRTFPCIREKIAHANAERLLRL